jgi:hypothetical protein
MASSSKEEEKKLKALLAQIEAAKEALELAEKQKKTLEEQGAEHIQNNEALQHAIDMQKAGIEVEKAKLKIYESQLKALDEKVKQGKILTESEKEIVKLARERTEELEKAIELAEKDIENQEKMRDLAKDIAKTVLGVSDDWKKSWWGQIADSDDVVKSLKRLGAGFLSALNPVDLLGSTLMKVQESTAAAILSFSSSSAELAKTTSQGDEYNETIMDITDSNRSFGVGIQDSAAAIGELFTSMSSFSQLSKETEVAMAAQAAQLEKLGVSASLTGNLNDQFMKGMAMTAEQAMETNNELARLAMGIGIPVSEMAEKFEAALPALASYGSAAPKIFMKVTSAAKELGVAMDTLLGFTQQFDTFEGAASAVGKLNNILGGDLLNSYEMINASEEERIELLLRGVESSNMSWESMSRFEKMALANAAGITDMAEANKIFQGGLSAYQQSQIAAEKNAVSQSVLEERTRAAVSIQEKFNTLMESFAVFVEPIVGFLGMLLDSILSLNDAMGGMLVPVLIGVLGLFVLWQNSLKAQAFLTGILKIFNIELAASTGAVGGAAGGAAPAVSALTASLAALASPPAIYALVAISAFALGVGLAAVGAALFVYSLVELVKIFMKMPEAIFPAIGGLALFLATLTGFIALIALMLPIAPAFLISATLIGSGMMALVPGFILLSAALYLISESLKNFEGVTQIMYDLPFAMAAFALGLALSGVLMLAAAATFGIGAAAVGVGLFLLAIPLSLFNNRTVKLIAPLGVALMLLGATLIAAGIFMAAAALVFGIGAIAVGLGLLLIGLPLMLFNSKTVKLIAPLGVALTLLGLTLIAAGIFMAAAALVFGIGAIAVGLGLLLIGLPLLLFNKKTVKLIAPLGEALMLLGATLIAAGIFMTAAAIVFGIGAVIVGAGLLALGLGLLLFSNKTVKLIAPLGEALMMLGLYLTAAGIPLMIGGALLLAASVALLPAALFLAPALLMIGLAVNTIDTEKLIGISENFIPFAAALLAGSFLLLAAAVPLLAGAAAFQTAEYLMEDNLQRLAERLQALAPNLSLITKLGPELLGLINILERFLDISFGFSNFASSMEGLSDFMIDLGFSMLFVDVGEFKTFAESMSQFSISLSSIGASLGMITPDKVNALQGLLNILVDGDKLAAVSESLSLLAAGIWSMSAAIASLEEVKLMSFSHLITAVTDASVKVTPEGIDNVSSLVEKSAEYAEVQAETRVPDEDSFVQALRAVFGNSKGGGASAAPGGSYEKRDIILQINGRELGRAIDAYIDDRHNLKIM